MRFCTLAALALASVLSLGAWRPAQAADISVYVGYADNLRPSPFFPNPWDGSPNTIFVGAAPSGYDAGAIRIDNTSASAITINDVSVVLPTGPTFDLWGSNVIPAHQSLILTQTTSYNFDTSDSPSLPPGNFYPDGGPPGSFALVTITANGTPKTYDDTGHVLTTGGSDLAAFNNMNESLQWRPIGTTGVSNPGGVVPEPSTLATAGIGALTLLGYTWRRHRRAARA
jgi:hypothetical protein